MTSFQKINYGIWLLIAVCLIVSATDEMNHNLQRYLTGMGDDKMLDNSKRFQQIMQGGGGAHPDVSWPQPKLKTEYVDVKAEIAKLNTSYVYQSSWPDQSIKLGAVTAVSFDKAGNVVIFHRVDRIWQPTTFDNFNTFQERHRGPIRNCTVLTLDRKNGGLIHSWGKDLFYMPHGLTVDTEDNIWLTDVALHQVFKFGSRGGADEKPLMTLGTAFIPGTGDKFCKPTAVAVLENGDFFVADGYCNARILKYSKEGVKILSWGQNSFSGVSYEVAPKNFFAIPHALALVPEQKLVCAADRENGRVQCFFWTNGTFHSQYHNQIIGDRLFSMDYTPAQGGQLVIVNGPTAELGIKPEHYNEVRGFVLNMQTNKVMSKFGPNDLQFSNPHDVAVTNDAMEIYVAELNPMRIHKFLHKKLVKSVPISASKPTTTIGIGPEYYSELDMATIANKSLAVGDFAHENQSHGHPGGAAILVASLMLLFAFVTFALALLIAHRRKRGCMPFGVNNRRHAWDYPGKSEGFKLGGLLLDRNKRGGFEKLDQNASDEEVDNTATTTSILSSAQFA